MRPSKVDLNLFVVFEAVYRTRNLTRAAELLFITQPAVSNALARMRKAFDDPLFVSTPAGMTPTPVSENIIGRAREALQLLDSSTHAGERFDPASSQRTFRLSMNDLTETMLLPALEEVLQRLAPGIRIESYCTTRRDVPEALAPIVMGKTNPDAPARRARLAGITRCHCAPDTWSRADIGERARETGHPCAYFKYVQHGLPAPGARPTSDFQSRNLGAG